jgi:sulfide:quinone oxidoreductase
MLLDDYFRRRGFRADVSIETSTPQPMSLPVVGAAGCAQVEGLLAEREIGFTPSRKVVRIEGTTVVTEAGPVPAEVLIGVPPHRPPAVIRESGLTLRGDWIAVDTKSMRASADGVFAVGDVTEVPLANGMPLPKAGVLAEAEGKVAAATIIAEINGRPAPAGFDGRGYCFVETGGEQAAMVQGDFLASPAPSVRILGPSASGYQEKLSFESSRLSAWFR